MSDRPIIFSAPMVRAMLDGRKTQTRRVLKPQPIMHDAGDCTIRGHRGPVDYLMRDVAPRFWAGYAPGDKLWVREKHCFLLCPQCDEGYPFTSSRPCICGTQAKVAYFESQGPGVNVRWRSPIHMPRWASRLTLIVTDVRVQRVQEISGMDAKREGVSIPAHLPGDGADLDHAKRAFRDLWDSLNAKRGFGWSENPWVVALSFETHHQNIDQMQREDAA